MTLYKEGPGSMNKRIKSCVLLPAAGRRTQLFHLIYTEPGPCGLADPCSCISLKTDPIFVVNKKGRAPLHIPLSAVLPCLSSFCRARCKIRQSRCRRLFSGKGYEPRLPFTCHLARHFYKGAFRHQSRMKKSGCRVGVMLGWNGMQNGVG